MISFASRLSFRLFGLLCAVPACVAVLDGCSAPYVEEDVGASEGAATACAVTPERSLVIVDRKVLDDGTRTAPGEVWSFTTQLGRLLRPNADLRNAIEGAGFAPEPIRHHWPLAPDGKLDPASAPYRLLGVVLRPEGTRTSLGELRLVFEAYAGGALGQLVSFEYGIDWRNAPPGQPKDAPPPTTQADAQARRSAWVDAWRVLETKPFGSAAYVEALADLTDAVTRQQASLRTVNMEVRRTSGSWSFTSIGVGGWRGLEQKPLIDTPPFTWNDPKFRWQGASGWGASCGGWAGGSCAIDDPLVFLVTRSESALHDGTFTFPESERATEVTGTSASSWGLAFDPPEGWTAERWERARVLFSRRTCDGCHGADTGSAVHHLVPPQGSGPATLSAFMRDRELPQRMLAYRAVVCGGSALPSSITDVGESGVSTETSCTKEGAIASEPCGNGGRRYAVCVKDRGKLVVSDRSKCIDDGTIECAPGMSREEPCGRCGKQRFYCYDFRWSGSTCSNEGSCSAGSVDETSAGCEAGKVRRRTCSPSCGWEAYGSCVTP